MIDNAVITHLLLNTGGFLAAAALCWLLTPIFAAVSRRCNLLDRPQGRKAHREPTPFLGGAAVFTAFWAVVGLGLLVSHAFAGSAGLPRELADMMTGISHLTRDIGLIFLGSLFIFALGLLDDVFNLSPWIKLLGQLLSAMLLVSMGYTINFVHEWGWAGYAITLLWVTLVINAFNFIDSIDGHCAGIAMVSAAAFFWLAQILNQPVVGLFAIMLAGVLAGFLPHNFKPAKIFLGDNGSLCIGYLLAALTLLCTYQVSPGTMMTRLIPVLMFGVPLYDTVSVVTVRLIRGIAPWKGDRNHFAHRLCRMGMSDKIAVTFSYFVALTLGLIAILATQITTALGMYITGLLFTAIMGIIAFLEYYSALRMKIAENLREKNLRRRDDIRNEEDRLF